MRCQKIKRDGSGCGASALTGKKHCALHADPKRAAELGSKGGRRRAIFSPDQLMPFSPPKTAAEVRDLLAQSMVEARAGQLDPRIVTSICDLANEFWKALEVCTIEEVVEPLERERAQQRGLNHATNRKQEDSQKTG